MPSVKLSPTATKLRQRTYASPETTRQNRAAQFRTAPVRAAAPAPADVSRPPPSRRSPAAGPARRSFPVRAPADEAVEQLARGRAVVRVQPEQVVGRLVVEPGQVDGEVDGVVVVLGLEQQPRVG